MNEVDVYKLEKKNKLFIHAGFHKTGTTTIQYSLDKKRVFKDCHYLDLKNPIHSWAISCIVGARKREPYKFIISNENGEHEFLTYNKEHTITFLKNSINSPKDNHVISGEDIARFSLQELLLFKDLSRALYHKVEVIIYIRSPFSYIVSSYQEMLKSGTLPPPINKNYLLYEVYIKNLDSAFGKESVNIYKFDRNELVDSDILIDFLHQIGADGATVPNISTNTSLSKETFSLLYVYAKFHKDFGYQTLNFRNDIFLSKIKFLDATKLFLTYNWAEQVIRDCCEEIAWVESRAGFSLKENVVDKEYAFKDESDILNYALIVYPALEQQVKESEDRDFVSTDDREQVYFRIIKLLEALFQNNS